MWPADLRNLYTETGNAHNGVFRYASCVHRIIIVSATRASCCDACCTFPVGEKRR